MAGEFKPGVKWSPTEALQRAHNIASAIYGSLGVPFVVTSGTDGRHSAGSLHYSGNAMDLRRRDLDAAGKTSQAVAALKSQLGSDYDVILESDHIHVEYDPTDSGTATVGATVGMSGVMLAAMVIGFIFLLKR